MDTFAGLLLLFVQLSVKLLRHAVLLARKEFTVVTVSRNAAVLKQRADGIPTPKCKLISSDLFLCCHYSA